MTTCVNARLAECAAVGTEEAMVAENFRADLKATHSELISLTPIQMLSYLYSTILVYARLAKPFRLHKHN